MSEPMSNPENREREIFGEALEITSEEARSAFLKGACRGDDELYARVVALLEAHAAAGEFIPTRHGATEEQTLKEESPLAEVPGTMIGRYKIREKIGEGGCGVVYVAEQELTFRTAVNP